MLTAIFTAIASLLAALPAILNLVEAHRAKKNKIQLALEQLGASEFHAAVSRGDDELHDSSASVQSK